MGGVIAEVALLCCCSCCGEIGTACKNNLGPQKVVKVFYMLLLLAIIVPFLILTFLLNKLSGWINLTLTYIFLTQPSDCKNICDSFVLVRIAVYLHAVPK
jgi:hypothetical protein